VSKLIKVWWHCLWRLNGSHRMCSLRIIHGKGYKGKGPKHHYCECGYMEDDFVKSYSPKMRGIK